MSLLVKICGLSVSSDVQAAIEFGADAVGFVFADSVREVTPSHAAAISEDLPGDVLRVAVMRHPSPSRWADVMSAFSPDVLQTDAEDFSGLSVPDEVQRWPVYREGGVMPSTDSRFLFEGKNSGRGETVDWANAERLARLGELILAGGLSPSNIAEAISTVRPFGVDVSSGVESAPGKKDREMIKAFINAARAAEKEL